MCLAVFYAINLSTQGLRDRSGQLKGTDFIHFYVLGSLALNGQATALYDYKAQAAHAAALVPESSGVYYLPIYGPQMSLLFAPLAALPYAWALLMWSFITTSIYALCCAAFWRNVQRFAPNAPQSSIWRRDLRHSSTSSRMDRTRRLRWLLHRGVLRAAGTRSVSWPAWRSAR
jgi:hypothetical protein